MKTKRALSKPHNSFNFKLTLLFFFDIILHLLVHFTQGLLNAQTLIVAALDFLSADKEVGAVIE